MGRNAQRRRAATIRHPDAPKPLGFVTKTQRALRLKAAQIQTQQQFEEILDATPPDHRAAVRRLLTPWLRPDLPCCGPGYLMRVAPTVDLPHTARCPSRNLVVLA